MLNVQKKLLGLSIVAACYFGCSPETLPAPEPGMRSDAGVGTAKTAMTQSAQSAQSIPAQSSQSTAAPALDTSTMRGMTGTAQTNGAADPAAASAGEQAGSAGTAVSAQPDAGATRDDGDDGDDNQDNATTTAASEPAECTQLATCCATAGALDRRDCQRAAEAGDAAVCMRASSEFCEAAMTTAEPTQACMQLSQCCPTLDGLAQRDCMETATEARDDRCIRLLERRCPEQAAPPEEPACAPLYACCAGLSERALENCRRALRDGDRRDCERAQAELCP